MNQGNAPLIPSLRPESQTQLLTPDMLSLLKLSIPAMNDVRILDLIAATGTIPQTMTDICSTIKQSKVLFNF